MKINSLFFTLLFLFVGSFVFGQITLSKHNFSSAVWNTTGPGEICQVCHTPHGATLIPDAPLWNHATTSATYIPYSSPTLNAVVGQPAGSSKLCLSCHDNTVALGGTTFIITVGTPVGYANLGTDLSNDHPISFTYDANLHIADPGLFDPTITPSGIGAPGATITTSMLYNGKLECASCHDVHNSAGIAHMLRKSNAQSALCLTCHNK